MTIKTDPRFEKITIFLKNIGLENAVIKPLAGDASFRRYDRILDKAKPKNPKNYILMDAPPPQEDVRPFIAIANHLNDMGFSAPKIHNSHINMGFLLLEDLGDLTYNEALKLNPNLENKLYKNAIDCLVKLQCQPIKRDLIIEQKEIFKIGAYNSTTLFKEFNLLIDWYLPEVLKNNTLDHKSRTRGILEGKFDELTPFLDTFVLRDYHADNLMHLGDRKGHSQVGLLDFQDALIGHKAYDLVSLLEDARRDVSPQLESAMINRFLKGHGENGNTLDKEQFLSHYHLLGAQRNAKIIGIFTRLLRRDGKSQFLSLIPRVLRLFERNLEHPSLKGLKTWFDETLPPERRGVPSE